MNNRTPEQARCYELLKNMSTTFGEKYGPIISILKTEPGTRKNSIGASRAVLSQDKVTRQEDSLTEICKKLWWFISPISAMEYKEDSNYFGFTGFGLAFEAGKHILEPAGVNVVVWLETQKKFIQNAIQKIKEANEQGISAKQLQQFFIDMERDFNYHSEDILNLPYLMMPSTFTRTILGLEEYYNKLVLLLEINEIDKKNVEELRTLVNILRKALDYDFSSNMSEGISLLIEVYYYLENNFDCSRDSDSIFYQLLAELYRIMFKKII